MLSYIDLRAHMNKLYAFDASKTPKRDPTKLWKGSSPDAKRAMLFLRNNQLEMKREKSATDSKTISFVMLPPEVKHLFNFNRRNINLEALVDHSQQI